MAIKTICIDKSQQWKKAAIENPTDIPLICFEYSTVQVQYSRLLYRGEESYCTTIKNDPVSNSSYYLLELELCDFDVACLKEYGFVPHRSYTTNNSAQYSVPGTSSLQNKWYHKTWRFLW
jgi:hypothetical protein